MGIMDTTEHPLVCETACCLTHNGGRVETTKSGVNMGRGAIVPVLKWGMEIILGGLYCQERNWSTKRGN